MLDRSSVLYLHVFRRPALFISSLFTTTYCFTVISLIALSVLITTSLEELLAYLAYFSWSPEMQGEGPVWERNIVTQWLSRVLTTLMSSRYTLEMASSSSKPHGWNFIILYRNSIICFILAENYFYLFLWIVHCGMFNYLFTHSIHRYERCMYVSQESNMPLATRFPSSSGSFQYAFCASWCAVH